MRLPRAVVFLFISLSILTFSFCADPAENKTIGSVADLKVEEYPSIINLSKTYLEISVYPNRTTYGFFDVIATYGNINVTVNFTLEGNITDFPKIFQITENPVIVEPMSRKSIRVDVDSNNVPPGNYTGNLTATVLETGQNETMEVKVINDLDRGRFIITVMDEAKKPLRNSYIELYRRLDFLEAGYTSSDGKYYSRYYQMDLYYVIVASKSTYFSKATGIHLEEVDHHINITLSGTPKLALYPEEYHTWMWVGQHEDMELVLYNYGNGRERWIYVDPTVSWLHPDPRYYEELEPGGYRYIKVRIGPFSRGGIYTGKIVADGLRTRAEARFQVTVYQYGEGPGGGYGTPGTGPTGPIIITNETYPFQPSDEPPYLYPRVSISTERSISLTRGIPYSLFVSVENVGDMDLTSLTLEATGIDYAETHPKQYYSLRKGEKRIFLVRVLATNMTSGNLRIKVDSKELETYTTVPYTVSIGEVDYQDLFSEINSLRELLQSIDMEILRMNSEGYRVTGAFSLVSVINSQLNTAERYFEDKEYYNTRKWLDMSIKDIDTLWMVIERIRRDGPHKVSETGAGLLFIIILISLALLYYIRKRREKK